MRGERNPALVIGLLVLVLSMLACGSTPTATSVPAAPAAPKPTDAAKPTDTAKPAATAKPTDTAKPAATPTATRIPPTPTVAGSFGDGTKIVGADVQPGTYRTMGGTGCYWERLKGFGGTLDDILANGSASGPTIVTIAATDKGFKTQRCGTWQPLGEAITSSPTAPFGEGTFVVGKDIAAGTWKSDGTGACYWQRLRGFSGKLDDIIANANVTGSTVVEIGATDAGFSSTRCGKWTKVN